VARCQTNGTIVRIVSLGGEHVKVLLVPESRLHVSRRPAPQRDRPLVRRAHPGDRADLVEFVRELSPTSTQHRFLTGLGGRVPASLVERLLTGGAGGGALVAIVDGRLVAHALWARAHGSVAPVAEIAMVVADRCQRQGIGSLLLEVLTAEMACAGIERVQVVTGAANRPVLNMIARRRPGAKAVERDGATLTYDFPVSPA
jgi:GNAT superfamily N-acetyltransferase